MAHCVEEAMQAFPLAGVAVATEFVTEAIRSGYSHGKMLERVLDAMFLGSVSGSNYPESRAHSAEINTKITGTVGQPREDGPVIFTNHVPAADPRRDIYQENFQMCSDGGVWTHYQEKQIVKTRKNGALNNVSR